LRERISLEQNLINHIGFVIDGSASMSHLETSVINVADELVKFLGEESVSRGQETRTTMYIFGADSQVACYDIDVLRSPSLRGMYRATGPSTALVDATYKAIEDMKQTATLYGDHAFLLYVITDGEENSSYKTGPQLARLMATLPNNWTLACLVPDRMSQSTVLRYGFSLENTRIWDARSKQGVQEVSRVLQAATQSYYDMRASGTRSTSNLFSLNKTVLDTKQVNRVLDPLPDYAVQTLHVGDTVVQTKELLESKGIPYYNGLVYYQLVKNEHIQPQKNILIRDKLTGNIYGGPAVRQTLGLPDYEVKVEAAKHPLYDIFVQSTAPNRKLMPKTDALIYSGR
jgi:hypothetical protein